MSETKQPSRVQINGTDEAHRDESVADLLRRLGNGGQTRGIAVAVNDEVVPRGRWSERRIRAGDRIEIVGAVQGG